MNEQKKYEVIKKLVDENGNKQRAATELQLSIRQINRLMDGYRCSGKSFFAHKNRGRKPANTIPDETKRLVIDLYKTKYYGANFTHYTELLERIEGIKLSVSAISSILESEYILSPRVTKAKKKRVKKDLEQKVEAAKTKKEADAAQKNLVAMEDAHSRRPRCAYLGELQQMDASPYLWFGDKVTSLHIAIDDATGRITGGYFDNEETLSGYYHVLYQILTDYGIPYKFLTDRRTVFLYKRKNTSALEEDTYTQFSYACKQLGIHLECSSVPQAKGRVERMFETLQSRLPIEMRLAGVTDLETANEFLNHYIKEFNAKFALPVHGIKSVFEVQPEKEKINLTLAILTERTVDNGHCIQFRRAFYRMLDANGSQVHYQKGTKAMVIQAYDGQLFCCVNDKDIYVLEEVPIKETKSKEFDIDYPKPVTRVLYIPAMNHPWRRQSFGNFIRKQQHRQEVLAREKA